VAGGHGQGRGTVPLNEGSQFLLARQPREVALNKEQPHQLTGFREGATGPLYEGRYQNESVKTAGFRMRQRVSGSGELTGCCALRRLSAGPSWVRRRVPSFP